MGVTALLLVVVFNPFRPQRGSRRDPCFGNVKSLVQAVQLYADDYDDVLPQPSAWQDQLEPYWVSPSRIWTCPERPRVRPGYAYNAALRDRTLKAVPRPELQAVVFESGRGVRNAADRVESFVAPHGGNRGWGNVAVLDGRVRSAASPPPADAGLRP